MKIWSGESVRVVTRYDDVRTVLSSPHASSDPDLPKYRKQTAIRFAAHRPVGAVTTATSAVRTSSLRSPVVVVQAAQAVWWMTTEITRTS
ncbi:hypothetical protein [Streptomyces sp. NPDC047315]|uniref:hypothetical protein n=1 Tax=Streptomyces sp. NPDC047315 TaxID=3155142 RepID=UPI0033DEB0FA